MKGPRFICSFHWIQPQVQGESKQLEVTRGTRRNYKHLSWVRGHLWNNPMKKLEILKYFFNNERRRRWLRNYESANIRILYIPWNSQLRYLGKSMSQKRGQKWRRYGICGSGEWRYNKQVMRIAVFAWCLKGFCISPASNIFPRACTAYAHFSSIIFLSLSRAIIINTLVLFILHEITWELKRGKIVQGKFIVKRRKQECKITWFKFGIFNKGY